MANKLEISVISPERLIYSGDADSITVPGINGEMGILYNHAPMISELGIGILTIMDNNDPIRVVIEGGFIEVKKNQVNILANGGGRKETINLSEAEKMLEATKELPPSIQKVTQIKKAKTRILIHND